MTRKKNPSDGVNVEGALGEVAGSMTDVDNGIASRSATQRQAVSTDAIDDVELEHLSPEERDAQAYEAAVAAELVAHGRESEGQAQVRVARAAARDYREVLLPMSRTDRAKVVLGMIGEDYMERHGGKMTGFSKKLTVPAVVELVLALDGPAYLVDRHEGSDPSPRASIAIPDAERPWLFSEDPAAIVDMLHDYEPGATQGQTTTAYELMQRLARRRRMVRERTDTTRYVPVANGVYDFRQKVLLSYDQGDEDEREFAFTYMLPVRYDKHATNPVFPRRNGQEWSFDEWLEGLASHEQDKVEVLWQVMNAAVRAGVSTRMSMAVFFVSARGSNGKGTLLDFIVSSLSASPASIKLEDFGKRFSGVRMVGASLVYSHENSTGEYLEHMADFKAAVSGDPIAVEEKGKPAFEFRPRALQIHCLNSMPKTKDKSGSLTRRILPIEFAEQYLGAAKDPDIKDVFLKDPTVAEYVLRRVLEMPDFEQFTMPASSASLLAEMVEANDPVVEFWNYFKDDFSWDMLPLTFLYDLYKAWVAEFNPSGTTLSLRAFVDQLGPALENDVDGPFKPLEYDSERRVKQYRPGHLMDLTEPLITAYRLMDWMSPGPSGRLLPVPILRTKYRAVIRREFTADPDA